MISSDVKANKNNNKIKDLTLSYKFLCDIPSKLGISNQYFSFDFDWYSVHFDIVH